MPQTINTKLVTCGYFRFHSHLKTSYSNYKCSVSINLQPLVGVWFFGEKNHLYDLPVEAFKIIPKTVYSCQKGDSKVNIPIFMIPEESFESVYNDLAAG